MLESASVQQVHGRSPRAEHRNIARSIPPPRWPGHDFTAAAPISPAHISEAARRRSFAEQQATDIAAGW